MVVAMNGTRSDLNTDCSVATNVVVCGELNERSLFCKRLGIARCMSPALRRVDPCLLSKYDMLKAMQDRFLCHYPGSLVDQDQNASHCKSREYVQAAMGIVQNQTQEAAKLITAHPMLPTQYATP